MKKQLGLEDVRNVTKEEQMLRNLGIKKIHRGEDAVVIILDNGSKGVARRNDSDHWDPAIGFSMAYTVAKATKGNKSMFKRLVKKIIG